MSSVGEVDPQIIEFSDYSQLKFEIEEPIHVKSGLEHSERKKRTSDTNESDAKRVKTEEFNNNIEFDISMSEKQIKKNLEITVEELLGMEVISKSSGVKTKLFSKLSEHELQCNICSCGSSCGLQGHISHFYGKQHKR